ncbi:MAG: hypothetical protein ABS23_11645 [SAR92 bacterium BACL16 MAG-120619-bin48]|jgi:hypothetical protein|nr:MAG: hypothetical protein ABS23_11645 [SAR92 bacterium BACL16 MAG-120619-bin48]
MQCIFRYFGIWPLLAVLIQSSAQAEIVDQVTIDGQAQAAHTLTVGTKISRIKRVALQTPNLDLAIRFFTQIVGFTLDFKGVVEANTEPYL